MWVRLLGGLVLLLPTTVAAQSLPQGVLDAVARAGEVRVARGTDINRDACRHMPRMGLVAVRGDFDGDRRQDWALYLLGTRTVGMLTDRTPPVPLHRFRFVFAMARANGRFELVTVRESDDVLPLPHYLALQRPGRIQEPADPSTAVVLRHPGVIELYCGQAASTYFWDPRERLFRYIVTGD